MTTATSPHAERLAALTDADLVAIRTALVCHGRVVRERADMLRQDGPNAISDSDDRLVATYAVAFEHLTGTRLEDQP